MRVRVAAAVLVAAAASATGCGGADTVDESALSRLVLRQADVGVPFSSFYTGPQVRLDNAGTSRSNPTRDGRQGGWIARYHRPGSRTTKGPLVIESRADLFSRASGAADDLEAYRQEFAATPGTRVRMLRLPKLGDEAAGVTFVQVGGLPTRFFKIAWRDRNVSAAVTIQGFDAKVTAGKALELARRQERRIASA